MNMKYVFIILFMICTDTLFAQKYIMGEGKTLNYWSQDFFVCRLHIVDNQYCIVFSVLTGDIVRNMFVSYGDVRKKGNLYHLKDIPTSAEIVLEKNKQSNFNIKKGFSFMQNESFIYDGKANSSIISMIDIDSAVIKKKKDLLFIKSKESSNYTTVQPGKYKNGNICLFIEQNCTYKILYIFEEYPCLVSKGKWSKDGNIMELYDPFLDYSLTAMIGVDGELTVIDFPNELNEKLAFSLVRE